MERKEKEMKQIEEMKKDLIDIFDEEYYRRNLITPQNTAEKLAEKGYRKQADIENYIPLDVHESLKRRAVEREKAEVAREILGDIEKEVASKIPMKIQPIFNDDRDFEGGFINGKTDALLDVLVLVAELKKKYTEVEK
jgi:hypothetical protein